LLLIACSPQKKLNRLINKYPYLVETKIDTIYSIDTVIILDYDTTVVNNIIKQRTDTVIYNEKVFLKYFYDTLRQEIIHEVECFGDTIIKEKIIPYKVEKVVYKELTWWQQYKHLILIFALLILALIVLKKLGKLI
jgi:hypothetical protein